MSDKSAEERVLSGEIWDDFCDRLKELGQIIQREDAPQDAFTKTQGYRYLLRLVRGFAEGVFENGSPNFPVMSNMGNMVKMGSDNPDNIYQGAQLNSEYEFRLSGNRGSVHYLGISATSGMYSNNNSMLTHGFIDSDHLEVDENGNFEIIISKKEYPGNWLKMENDTSSLVVRQTLLDRENEVPATLSIERLGNEHLAPEPLTAETLDMSLQRLTGTVSIVMDLFAGWSATMKDTVNTLPPADQEYCQSIGGDPNIFYFHSYWELEDDEVLVIHAPKIPECTTWNFQLNNYWLESMDYRFLNVTVNKHTAKYNDDGSVTLYICKEDPGIGNWMDTNGHNLGTMSWRWIGADEYPLLETKVLKKHELVS